MVGFLPHCRKCLTPLFMLYIYNSDYSKNEGFQLLSPCFPFTSLSKNIYVASWVLNYFPPYNYFPFHHLPIASFMVDVQMSYML